MSRLNIPSNSQQIIGKNKKKERRTEQVWKVIQGIQVGPESSLCRMGKGKGMEFEEKVDASMPILDLIQTFGSSSSSGVRSKMSNLRPLYIKSMLRDMLTTFGKNVFSLLFLPSFSILHFFKKKLLGFEFDTNKVKFTMVAIILEHGGWLQEGGKNWAGRGGIDFSSRGGRT